MHLRTHSTTAAHCQSAWCATSDIKSLIDDQPSLAELLPHEQQCMDAYRSQITQEYARIQQRLNRGLIKSVIFIIITKSLIGISIEVPYDLLVHGKISWVPLGVNLLFPPVYMALLRTAIRMPSPSNTQALVKAAHTMLLQIRYHSFTFRLIALFQWFGSYCIRCYLLYRLLLAL